MIVFPMSAKGKYAVAEGVVTKVSMTLEQTESYLRHQADETGEPFDPSTAKEPLTFVMLKGTGAVVSDRR